MSEETFFSTDSSIPVEAPAVLKEELAVPSLFPVFWDLTSVTLGTLSGSFPVCFLGFTVGPSDLCSSGFCSHPRVEFLFAETPAAGTLTGSGELGFLCP